MQQQKSGDTRQQDNQNAEQQNSMPSADQMAHNPNPRANENIRVRSATPDSNAGSREEVGSEITDGEDG